MTALATVVQVGVEGTGSYGAGLAAMLREHRVSVVEVDRPNRRARRRKGKSDSLDAVAAARAAVSGEADGTPKSRSGPVEAIRVLRVARRGAVQGRTAAINQLHGLILSAPDDLRESPTGLSETAVIARCAVRGLPHRHRPCGEPGRSNEGCAARAGSPDPSARR